ncbi:hypothetical protein [Acidovorax sp.]|uniref:hypothetical protein n=1 Tax=Acidovorax sp. TaxID=1872122 RepID=UPI003D094717
MTSSTVPIGGGVEKDPVIAAALVWLGESSGDQAGFSKRLEDAQRTYRAVVADANVRSGDPSWDSLGSDRVASFFAQAKSLLDDRASYDFALVSHVAPWIKQLGVNLAAIQRIQGAQARAKRMLKAAKVHPDTAMFELVMASNYAAEGFDVTFVEEGARRTPDLRVSFPGMDGEFFVELKRLQQGRYEVEERKHQTDIFRCAEVFIDENKLSLDIDVMYDQELHDVPRDYLTRALERFKSSSIVVPGGYPWKDEFGSGTIRPANMAAVHRDTRDSYLYTGIKLARLLSGRVVSENNYHIAAHATRNTQDARYIDRIHFGSVVTWRSAAPEAIERKAKYVRSKLAEADKQLEGHGRGVVHIAMDTEVNSEASDLRRRRNFDVLQQFRAKSDPSTVYLHYLVPRISENHSWILDETVETFSRFDDPPPSFPAFPNAPTPDNDLPAWKQEIDPHA